MRVERPEGYQVETAIPNPGFVEPQTSNVDWSETFGTLVDQGREFVDDIATTQATEALNKFKEEVRTRLWDPESGYFNSEGKQAYVNYEETIQSLQDLKQKYIQNLSVLAQSKFEEAASAELDNAILNIKQHAVQGQEVWQEKESELAIQGIIQDASTLGTNPEMLAVKMQAGMGMIVDRANENGWGQDVAQEQIDIFKSNYLSSAVRGLLAMGNVEEAKALFEQHKDDIQGSDFTNLMAEFQQRAQQAAEAAELQRVDGIFQTIISNNPGDVVGALRAAMSLPGELAVDMRGRVLDYYGDIQYARELAADRAYRQLKKVASDVPNATPGWLATNYPNRWQALTVEMQNSFQQAPEPKPDLTMQILTAPAAEVADLSPSKIRANFPDQQADKIIDEIEQAREVMQSGGPELDLNPDVGRTYRTRIGDIIASMYGDDVKPGDDEYAAVRNAWQIANQMAIAKAKDGELTAQDISEIEDALVTPIGDTTPEEPQGLIDWGLSFFRDPTTALADIPAEKQDSAIQHLESIGAEVSPENIVMYATGEIPPAARRQITAALEDAGYEISKENIMRVYFSNH